MRFKNRKWASPFFIVSLAIAGLFGVTASVLDTDIYKETEASSINYYARGTFSSWNAQAAYQFETNTGNEGILHGVQLSAGAAFKTGSSSWGNELGYDKIYEGCGAYSNFDRAVTGNILFTVTGSNWDYATFTSGTYSGTGAQDYAPASGTTVYIKVENDNWHQSSAKYGIGIYDNKIYVGTRVSGSPAYGQDNVIVKVVLPSDVYSHGFKIIRVTNTQSEGVAVNWTKNTTYWNESNEVESSGEGSQGRFGFGNNNIYVKTTSRYDIYATSGYANLSIEYANYKVTLNKNGGTINAGNVTSYQYGVGATLPTNVTKTGYAFGGWYKESDFSGSRVYTITTSDYGDKTYYAKWTANTYNLTYKDQGNVDYSGSNEDDLPKTHTYGQSTDLVDGVKRGYNFINWYTNSTCTIVAPDPIGATSITSNTTLYAKWQVSTFTIAFNANSGSGTMDSMTGVSYTSTPKLTANAFTKSGYRFDGWATSSSGAVVFTDKDTLTSKEVDSIFPGNGETATLYAKWTAVPTYDITFEIDSDDTGFGTLSAYAIDDVPEGSIVSIDGNQITINATTITATPTTDDAQYHYEFTGWVGIEDGEEIEDDCTITATFSRDVRSYTITWTNYNDSVLETDSSVTYGTTPSYDGATPTKPSTAQYTYSFTGWSPAVVPVVGNATYKAQFSSTVRSYTVTWQNYDGSTLETDSNVDYGTVPTYDGATPTKGASGTKVYTFTGWSPNPSAITGNTTYIAQFAETDISSGLMGGQTFYVVDNYYHDGEWIFTNDICKVTFYDNVGHSKQIGPCPFVYKTGGEKNTYEVVVPLYDGSDSVGWTKFKIQRYSRDGKTLDNETEGDLYFSFWKDYTEWWIDGYYTDGSGISRLKVGYSNNTALYGFRSGFAYYVEPNGWDSKPTGNVGVYFDGPIGTTGSAFILAKEVLGHAAGDYVKGLYEFIAPQNGGNDVNWHTYIVVELKPGCTDLGPNWVNVKKQIPTGDNRNTITSWDNTIKSSIGEGETSLQYNTSRAVRLAFFDEYLNTQVVANCNASGASNIDTLKAKWTLASGQLPYDTEIAKQIKTEIANPSGTVNQRVVATYDYIIHKYGTTDFPDFASRTAAGGAYSYSAVSANGIEQPYRLGSEENSGAIIIIISSSISLISVAALSFLIIKKKKSKETN